MRGEKGRRGEERKGKKRSRGEGRREGAPIEMKAPKQNPKSGTDGEYFLNERRCTNQVRALESIRGLLDRLKAK